MDEWFRKLSTAFLLKFIFSRLPSTSVRTNGSEKRKTRQISSLRLENIRSNPQYIEPPTVHPYALNREKQPSRVHRTCSHARSAPVSLRLLHKEHQMLVHGLPPALIRLQALLVGDHLPGARQRRHGSVTTAPPSRRSCVHRRKPSAPGSG